MTEPVVPNVLLSTREAAEMLGIVERTVLLHLERGELTGQRSGRRWRIHRASVEAHPNYRGASPSAARPPPPPGRSGRLTLPAPPLPPAEPIASELPPKRARREWTFRNLRVLTDLTSLAARSVQALANLPLVPPAVIDLALLSAQEAARHGAAGFHAFVKHDKVRLYAHARENAAMTAASLWIIADLAHDRAEGLRLVAREYEALAPGLGALMRSSASHDA